MLNTGQINWVFEKRYPGILFISRKDILTKNYNNFITYFES